jgi:hypothetical protein
VQRTVEEPTPDEPVEEAEPVPAEPVEAEAETDAVATPE